MTTRRIIVRREAVCDWPVFTSDSKISTSIGVVSIEVNRHLNEPIVNAAAMAAVTLTAAIDELTSLKGENYKFWQ